MSQSCLIPDANAHYVSDIIRNEMDFDLPPEGHIGNPDLVIEE
jgi:hypothetical protein